MFAKNRRLKCCHFVPSSLYQWRHKHSRHVWQKYPTRHEPTYSCSSLVKTQSTWMPPKELKFEAKLHFFCVHIDRTTNEAGRGKYLLIFHINFRPGVRRSSPLPSYRMWIREGKSRTEEAITVSLFSVFPFDLITPGRAVPIVHSLFCPTLALGRYLLKYNGVYSALE